MVVTVSAGRTDMAVIVTADGIDTEIDVTVTAGRLEIDTLIEVDTTVTAG